MLLLLFNARQAGIISTAAALLTLTAPLPVLDVTGGADVTLDATTPAITLTAPAAALDRVIDAGTPPPTITFSAPAPTVDPSGVTIYLDATACAITFSQGTAALSIDLTAAGITINGVQRGHQIRPASLTVTDNLDEAPDLATFVCHGFTPHVGEELIITIGTPTHREFGGHLTQVTQIYEGQKPKNIAYQCEAVDYTRLLDRRLVHAHYPAQSVSTTILQMLATFSTSTITHDHVESNLPAIAAIDFDWEPISRVLARLAQLIGAYWYIDPFADLHFYITEPVDLPDPIVDGAAHVQSLSRAYDLTQIRTEVWVSGQGVRSTVAVAAGDTLVPVDDVGPFLGQISAPTVYGRAAGQLLGFAYAYAGGGVAEVQGVTVAIGAPNAALAPGSGNVVGLVDYRVTFKSPAGETAPGPPSNGVTGVVTAPQTGINPTIAAGVGRQIGTFTYGQTYVTDRGETAISDTSAQRRTITATALPAPGFPTIGAPSANTTLGVLVGAFSYKVSHVTQYGETLPSIAGARTAAAFALTAGGPTGTQQANTIGLLPVGATYRWAQSVVTPMGETLLGSISAPVTIGSIFAPAAPTGLTTSTGGAVPTGAVAYAVAFVAADGLTSALGSSIGWGNVTTGNQTVKLTGIPLGPSGTIGRRIYRWYQFGQTTPSYVGDLTNNVDTTYTDDKANVGATAPSSGTIGGIVSLSVPVVIGGGYPAGTIKARRIYRTKAGGSTYFLLTEIPDNSTTTFVDNVLDANLTTAAPTVNTAGGEQQDVYLPTPVPAGVLARRIYRTTAGGSQYKLLVEIQDATTPSFRDNVTDANLGTQAPPLVSTAGGQTVSIAINTLTNPPGTVQAVRLYRTKNGNTTDFFLVGQVGTATNLVLLDNKTDDELGAAAPLVNTAGASRITVSAIPIGPAGMTARRVYRRDSAGLYRFLVELSDNTTTTTTDDHAESDLGDVAPTVSTLGALQGATSLLLTSTAPFVSTGGWALVGTLRVRYTGVSGATLTGIPASGPGSLTANVSAGTDVTASPMLAFGALPADLAEGTTIQIMVVRRDTAAQNALAAVEGGDGVHQVHVDDALLTVASANTRGDAELAQYAYPIERLTFTSRDQKLRSGKRVTVNLGAPTNISGTYRIQTVTLTQWGIPHLLPLRTVVASSVLYSFEHLLRRTELGA